MVDVLLSNSLVRRALRSHGRAFCKGVAMGNVLAFVCVFVFVSSAGAQGLPAGERARGESRCPVGTVGEAMPGGYRCVRPELVAAPQQGTPVQSSGEGAAGGQAQEVSRGAVGAPWPFAVGALAILGIGIGIAAGQGGGASAVSGTR